MIALSEHPYVIALSALIISAACYTAIDILGRVHETRGAAKIAWIGAGAAVLTSGFWTMRFLSLLAIDAAISLSVLIPLAIATWISGFFGSICSYLIVSQTVLRWRVLFGGSAFCTFALAGMFHLSMLSLNIEPAIGYQPFYTIVAMGSYYICASIGLWAAHRLRDTERLRGVASTTLASLIMGIGIASCDRIAMAAVIIPAGAASMAAVSIDLVWLTPLIVTVTLFIMALAVIAAVLDRRLDRQTADLLQSLRDSNARLEYSNRYDALTDLANRTTIHAHIEQVTRRDTSAHRVALLYIDLDGFKLINDSLGHTTGDRLLKRAAAAIETLLDERHLLARFGGDEFLLLQDGIDDEPELDRLAESILSELGDIHEHGATLSASVGIAIYPDDASDAVSLVTAADMAMYSAKRTGKNHIQRYRDRMGLQHAEAFQIQDELRHGIHNDELIVYYQPKFTAPDLHFAGAEALVRWQHPTRGLVSPGLFIEIAERSGLIRELELCVIETVCHQMRQWRDAGYVVPTISVNLSVARLLDEHLVDELRDALDRHDLSPRHLVFEITETLAMQEFDTATRVLNQLHELGVQIALDDFGTGYSSLSYLQTLPIQQLKIDRSFIANLGDRNSQYYEIVELIINLAHVLDIVVVAEGIETIEQQQYLQGIECDELQGFLLDRPMPAQDLSHRLEHRSTDTHDHDGPTNPSGALSQH